jgi:replicative DNA helicase
MVTQIDTVRNRQTASIPSVEPCSIEAEDAVLGALLAAPNLFPQVSQLLTPKSFYVPANQVIYRSIAALNKLGSVADLLGVSSYLQDKNKLDTVGGMARLTYLASSVVSPQNIDGYARIVAEKWARRECLHAGRDLAEIARDTTWGTDTLFEFVSKFVDRIAGLRSTFTPEDKTALGYTRLIDQIKAIEQGELDPGLKAFRLAELARKTGNTTRFLSGLYQKYLASFDVEPSLSLAELREKYGSQTQQWMLHGFGPSGSVVLLHAHGGVGKTRLIYDWVYSMATGQAWEGHAVTAPERRVLLVQTDESQGDLLTALEHRGFTDDMPIRIVTKWSADHMAGLRAEIEKFQPEVILIDSLTSINRNSLFSENDTEYARPVLELRDIAQETGALIYLVHHSNSQNGSRGTKAITASVSHVFSLHRPDGASVTNPNRILCVDKSRSRAPGEYLLEFNTETGGWQFNGVKPADKEIPDDDGDTAKNTILQFLTENRNVKYECREIQELLGMPRQTVDRGLSTLAHSGLISRAKVRTNKRGKPPTVYWVAWGNYAHEGITPTPKNSERKCERKCERNSIPCPEPVSDGGERNSQKLTQKSSEKNESFCKTRERNSETPENKGFEFRSRERNSSERNSVSLINAQITATGLDGATVAGELVRLGDTKAQIRTDKGDVIAVKATTIKPRPGHFSTQELEDMLAFEQERLGLDLDQVQAISKDVAGDWIEYLSNDNWLRVIYALRKLDPA